ncbi:MAG: flagellar protein [Cellulosilyticaceae bacterium]
MEVKTCKKCHKLFQYVTGPAICPACKQEEEKIFIAVKDFIRENKGATIEQVSRETGASVTLIEKFLKQGRLEVAEGLDIELTCERCGKSIKTGRYCDQCKGDIAANLDTMAKGIRSSNVKEEDTKARMRFLNKNK